MKMVTVMLLLGVPSDVEAFNGTHEILREHQRAQANGSNLVDFAVSPLVVDAPHLVADTYREGDAFRVPSGTDLSTACHQALECLEQATAFANGQPGNNAGMWHTAHADLARAVAKYDATTAAFRRRAPWFAQRFLRAH